MTSLPESIPIEHSRRRELKILMLIALPNVASMLSQTVMSFVDFYIVSMLPNATEAQAAVGSSAMVFFSLFSFLLGIEVCITTMVSQSFGAERHRDCSAYAWQGIWVSMIVGVLGLALWPYVPAIYRWFGHAPEVQAMEVVYTRIRLVAVGFGGATMALGHFFNGIHRPGQNTVTAVGANIFNAFLTYGLTLGAFGMPMLGVAGAALGTVAATAIRFGWLMALFCFSKAARPFEARATYRLDMSKVTRLLKVGWPAGIQFFIEITSWAIFLVYLIGRLGTAHLAATTIAFRYAELSFMPAVGIAMAVSTLVGKAIGEDRHWLARRRAAVGTAVNMVYMGAMATTYFLFNDDLMHIFSDDSAVLEIGAGLLIFVAIFQLSDAVGITYNNALRGAGDTLWPMLVGSILCWTVMVGGGFATIHYLPQYESYGPWACATAFVVLYGAAVFVRWMRGKWETLDVIGRKEAPYVAPPGLPDTEAMALEPIEDAEK